MRAQLACLVDGASATWLEETAIGSMEGYVWMQLLYVHVPSMCPREPSPVETADFHVSLETVVPLLHVMGLARRLVHHAASLFRSAQATNHLLDFSAPPEPS